MEAWKRAGIGIGIVALLILPFAYAISGTYNQTMTWNILANRSHSITYGGSCSASAFYFNEIDANFDPDNDGNAARILPSAGTRTTGTTTAHRDYNFVGVTSPSTTNVAYYGESAFNPPQISAIATELTDDDYTAISTINATGFMTFSNGQYPSIKTTFRSSIIPEKITSLTFRFSGINIHNALCDTETAAPSSSGIDKDINFFLWNFLESEYERIGTWDGSEAFFGHEVGEVDVNSFVDYNITRFIGGADRNITFLVQGDRNDTVFSCLYAETIQMFQRHYYDNNIFCQSSSIAPFTIRNNGNTDINVDGNFSSAFSGTDVNLVLKAWQGTGSGCGTNGMGGWEKDCSVTTATTDLGMTTCRQWNQSNGTTAGRLVTNLSAGDTNQLCFSGDINTYTGGGSYAKTFVTNDQNAT
jgi:hypothetical protein